MGSRLERASPAREPKNSFRVNAIGLVAVLAYIGWVIFILVTRTGEGNYVAERIGRFTGFLLIAYVLGWVGYRVSRRSSLVGNIIFAGIIALPILVTPIGFRDAAKQQIAWKKADQDVRERNLRMIEREIEGQVTVEEHQASSAQDREAFRQLVSKLPKKDAEVLKKVEKVLISRDEKSQAHRIALDAFSKAGGMDGSTLRSKSHLRQRLGLLDALILANETVAKEIKDYPKNVRIQLEPFRGNKTADSFIAAVDRGNAQLNLTTKLREVDGQLCQAHKAQLLLLEASWGRWSWSATNQQLVFIDDKILRIYNQKHNQIQKLAAEEKVIQRQMLESSQR